MRNENNNEIKNNTGHPNLGQEVCLSTKSYSNISINSVLYSVTNTELLYDVNIMLLSTKVQYCCFYE